MNVNTCLELAQGALLEGNYDAACEFFEVALRQEPNSVETLEAYGEVLLHHKQDSDRALQLLQHAAQVCPDEGHVKFSNLAQLLQGQDAVGCYAKALSIMRKELRKSKSIDEKDVLRRSIAETWAAMAELYLTDLCDEPDAEQQCERAVQEALNSCARCVDAHQTLGSLRLSQERFPEAKTALVRAVALCHELEEGLLPGYETRVELGKLLMQVSPRRAFDWLISVLHMDPGNAYVWFLLGETARLRRRHCDAARLLKHARMATADPDELQEIDAAIHVLLSDMGGPDSVNQVPHMDAANPLDVLEDPDPEEVSDIDDDADEMDDEVDSCADSDDDDAA